MIVVARDALQRAGIIWSPSRFLDVCVYIVAFLVLSGTPFMTVAAWGQDEPVFSGPQPGEAMSAFPIRGVYDDQAGKEIDLLSDVAERPVLLIFVHQLTRPSIGLTRALVEYAAKQQEPSIESAVVFLTDDVTATENWMKRARSALPKNSTLGIALGGQEGPGAYGLNRNVTLTILVGKEGKVTANFALVQPSLQADSVAVATALARTAGIQNPPTLKDLAPAADRRRRKPRD